jgi:hypothetical protein
MGDREQSHLGRSSGEQGGAVAAFSPEPQDASAASSPPSGMAQTERSPSTEAACGAQYGAVSTWRPPAVVGKYSIECSLGSGAWVRSTGRGTWTFSGAMR